jgi:hypothetical protein
MMLICLSILVGVLIIRKPLVNIKNDIDEMSQNVRELNDFFNNRRPPF